MKKYYQIIMTDANGLTCNLFINTMEQLKQEIADAVSDGFIEFKILTHGE